MCCSRLARAARLAPGREKPKHLCLHIVDCARVCNADWWWFVGRRCTCLAILLAPFRGLSSRSAATLSPLFFSTPPEAASAQTNSETKNDRLFHRRPALLEPPSPFGHERACPQNCTQSRSGRFADNCECCLPIVWHRRCW